MLCVMCLASQCCVYWIKFLARLLPVALVTTLVAQVKKKSCVCAIFERVTLILAHLDESVGHLYVLPTNRRIERTDE